MSKGENKPTVPDPEGSESGNHGGKGRNRKQNSGEMEKKEAEKKTLEFLENEVRTGILPDLDTYLDTYGLTADTPKSSGSKNEAGFPLQEKENAEVLEELKSRLRTVFPERCTRVVYEERQEKVRKDLSQEELISLFLRRRSGMLDSVKNERWGDVKAKIFSFLAKEAKGGKRSERFFVAEGVDGTLGKEVSIEDFLKKRGVNDWENKSIMDKRGVGKSGLGSSVYKESIDELAEETLGKPLEQKVPDEDGVVEGFGLVDGVEPERLPDSQKAFGSLEYKKVIGDQFEEYQQKRVEVAKQEVDSQYVSNEKLNKGKSGDLSQETKIDSTSDVSDKVEQGGLGSAVHREAIDELAEETLGKPLEQKVPNKDGVVEGFGLVEEPNPAIVFDEEEPVFPSISLEKTSSVESELGGNALHELYRQEEALRKECNEKGELYARVCGRNDSLRTKIFSKLPFLRKTIETQDEQRIAEMKMEYERSLSELRRVRVEIAKKEAEANGDSEAEVRKAMANELLFLDRGEAIRIAGLWCEEKRMDRRKSKALRVVEDLTKWYRSLPTSMKIGVGLTLFSASLLTGKSVPLFLLALTPRAGGAASLTESLGEIFGNRAFEQEIERMGREKKIDTHQEWSAADLEAFRRNETAVTEKFNNYRARISKQSKYLAGGGIALFLGGTAVSASGLLHAMEQVSNGASALETVKGVTHEIAPVSAVETNYLETVPSESDLSPGGVRATDIAEKTAESIGGQHHMVQELVVGPKGSIEGILNVSGFSDGDSHRAYLHFLEEMKTQGEDTAALDKLLQHGVRAGDTISVEMVDGKLHIVGIERVGEWKYVLQSFAEGNAQPPLSMNVSDAANPRGVVEITPENSHHTPDVLQTSIEQPVEPSSSVVSVPAVPGDGAGDTKTLERVVLGGMSAGVAALAGAEVASRSRKKRGGEATSNDMSNRSQEMQTVKELDQERSVAEAKAYFKDKILSFQGMRESARVSFKKLAPFFVSSPNDDVFRHAFVRKELCQVLFDEPEDRLSEDFLKESFRKVMGANGQEFLVIQALFEKTGEKFPWDIQYRSADDVLNLFAERFVTGKIPQGFSKTS